MKLSKLFENYVPRLNLIKQIYNDINKISFNNELSDINVQFVITSGSEARRLLDIRMNKLPDFVKKKLKDIPEGAEVQSWVSRESANNYIIYVANDFIDSEAELEQVIAHEMVHLYLAYDCGYEPMLKIGHGPKFLAFKDKIIKYKNTDLFNPRDK